MLWGWGKGNVCVCVCVFLCVSVCVCVSVCLSVSVSVCVCVCTPHSMLYVLTAAVHLLRNGHESLKCHCVCSRQLLPKLQIAMQSN